MTNDMLYLGGSIVAKRDSKRFGSAATPSRMTTVGNFKPSAPKARKSNSTASARSNVFGPILFWMALLAIAKTFGIVGYSWTMVAVIGFFIGLATSIGSLILALVLLTVLVSRKRSRF